MSLAQPGATGLSREQMLAVYGLTPLLMAVVVLDLVAFQGHGRQLLPHSPASLPVYSLVFGFPHVLASFFLLGDRELARGAMPVLWPSALIASVSAVLALSVLNSRQIGLALILTTMVHVVGQQAGLAAGQAGLRRWPWATRIWRLLMAGVGCAAGAAIGGEAMIAVVEAPEPWLLMAGVCLLLATPLGVWLAWQARRAGGDIRALFAIQATAMAGYALVLLGYPLLSIWLFRCVHDVTAFMVYGTVANARMRAAPGANRLYAWLGLRGAITGWVLWPLSIVLTAVAALALPGVVLVALSWTHYLAEHRIWRVGSPLRRWLALR
ncbi:hypothetical protein LRH25_06680 [Ideonella azotifigens]|uniref:DUF418 domain-containing protein n=1 Tax=Ideonella azotifigens TaxID=513160 RepID=A0ABP3V1H3_9BURK|nr:hypothetical protein [Ideonella azotifigens]MCD2340025.1 hypothetical protein [Ideonella azotifigens]